MAKVAVVLFNLGGPDGPEAVEPFLFNLFNDRAIIRLPALFRWPLAKLISRRRAPSAREIYDQIGGRSPLLPLTQEQASAIEDELSGDEEYRVFIAMRYWRPFSDDVAKDVAAFGPDEIILLPLYPQYSTTTTESSVKDWTVAAGRVGLSVPTKTICCYPTLSGFVEAQAELLAVAWQKAEGIASPRVLFSAHGLPKKIIDRGDPYQWQVGQTAQAIAAKAGLTGDQWVVCFQSRVGPMEWIGPSTEQALTQAGEDGRAAVVLPIAFVSEHSETLVELDIEYRDYAEKHKVPGYFRVPAVGTHPKFIHALTKLVQRTRHSGMTSADMISAGMMPAGMMPAGKMSSDKMLVSESGGQICPDKFGGCLWCQNR